MAVVDPIDKALAGQFTTDPSAAPAGDPAQPALPPSLMLSDKEVTAFGKSEEGSKLVAWLKREYQKAQDARRPYERQWYTNLAFYSGKQYVEWSQTEDRLITQGRTSLWTPRLTINKIQPIIRTEQAKLTGQKPSAVVMPSSNEDRDIFAAIAGEQVWESLYYRLHFQQKLSRATFWMSICGISYIKTFWDESMYDTTSGLYGDINWLPMSPMHVYVPDLLEEDIENQPFILIVQAKPIEWVTAAYGKFLPKGHKPSVAGTNDYLSAAGLGVRGDNMRPDSANVIEAWIKPNMTEFLPEGGMITVVDDVIVQASIHGLPYEHRQYPLAPFRHIPTGKFYTASTIEALIPLQREYNRTASQIVEAKNRMGKPQMFYREGSIEPTKITSEPGVYIPVKGSAQYPSPVPLTELPQYVAQFNERMQSDFEDISGQHQVSKGGAPAGVEAATAIAYLQESDDSYLATSMQSVEQGIEKIATQSLVLAATYWTVPRLVKATGEDGGVDAMSFRGSDIAGSTDIRINKGSALAESKAARQAQVTEWMKFGWIPPEEGFELLDMPALQQWNQRRLVDKKAAQIENLDFRALDPMTIQQKNQQWAFEHPPQLADPEPLGMPNDTAMDLAGTSPDAAMDAAPTPPPAPTATQTPTGNLIDASKPTPPVIPVNTFDNHAVHIQVHELMQKSPSYRFFSEEVKIEVQKHIDLHKLALAMKMQAQAAMGQPPAGAPPATVDSSQSNPSMGATQEQLAPPQ